MSRSVGVLIPLFSLRTRDDLGRGEIGGLVAMADVALKMGHRVIQLLPLDDLAPGETSPYTAMSVFAIEPMYLSARGLEGVDAASFDEARERVAGRGDYMEIRAAKLGLLERSFQFFVEHASSELRDEFESFIEAHREWVSDYALFRALKERFNWGEWERWPEPLRRRDATVLAEARRDLARDVMMYSYWQFLAHRQWLQVRTELKRRGVMVGGDLAFSPGRESAEVWTHQERFDLERFVGAPPDGFSATGQHWGLPMPRWDRIRSGGYELIRMRVRRARELYDLLRIDHVVGLFRTYSFGMDPDAPGGFSPALEAAQRRQGEEIIGSILEEAGPMAIIAEDLGLIPPFVRKSLKALGVPGYKVIRWEKENWGKINERFISPAKYPEMSVATTGTHDTDTLTIWWNALPKQERRQLCAAFGIERAVDIHGGSLDERALSTILEALYRTPSRLVLVPMQDLFGWGDRINTPGTVGPDNWSWRLPLPLEQMRGDMRVQLSTLRAIAERTGRFLGEDRTR
jgi:4-alpha-glucanotransferase